LGSGSAEVSAGVDGVVGRLVVDVIVAGIEAVAIWRARDGSWGSGVVGAGVGKDRSNVEALGVVLESIDFLDLWRLERGRDGGASTASASS